MWASIASAGISALGGALGSKSKRGPDMDDMRAYQIDLWQKELPARMQAAKAAGIHPLAALGLQGTPAGMSISGPPQKDYSWVQNMGQDIGRAFSAYQTKGERDMKAISDGLQLENQQLQNEFIRTQIRSMNAPGTGPGIGDGVRPGTGQIIPRSIYLRDRDGRLTEVLNPDAGDSEGLQIQDWLTRSLPNDVRNMTARSWDNLKSLFRRRTPASGYNPYRM